VILVDVNLLIYATFRSARRHEAARRWMEEKLSGPAAVGLPWHSLLGYVRIATNPPAYSEAISVPDAWSQVESWLTCEPVWIPDPTARHVEVLGHLLRDSQDVHSNLVSDAHLAALAIEHGLTLCSTDGDFARFRELKWDNPLAP
jgi:toxin-antitoxin system PIN domain toxin